MHLSSKQIQDLLQHKVTSQDLITYYSIISKTPAKEALKEIPRSTYYLSKRRLVAMGWLVDLETFLIRCGKYYKLVVSADPGFVSDSVLTFVQDGEVICQCLGNKVSDLYLGGAHFNGWYLPNKETIEGCVKKMEQ